MGKTKRKTLVSKRDNIYICPYCKNEYKASGDKVLTFVGFGCPNCGSTVEYEGNEKRRN